MICRSLALFTVFLVCWLDNAHALSLSPASFLSITNKSLSDIGVFVTLGMDLHAYEGAKPYSSKFGADIGATVTAISLPGDVVKALTDLGVPKVPHYIPIPKVNIQKAINKRLFFGSEFIPVRKILGASIECWGFDLQYTVIERPRLPPIAIRAQYNFSNLVFVKAVTYGGDVIISWDLALINIYGGGGYRFGNYSIANPTPFAVPSFLHLDGTTDAGHFVAGTVVNAGPMRVTAEANITTRGVNTYGSKLSFFF